MGGWKVRVQKTKNEILMFHRGPILVTLKLEYLHGQTLYFAHNETKQIQSETEMLDILGQRSNL